MKFADLAHEYLTDPMSDFHRNRYVTQQAYRGNIRRLNADLGDYELADITVRIIKERHAAWSSGGRIPMAHGMVTMLRIVLGFGAGILENDHCQRLRDGLSSVKFANGKPRRSVLTEKQVRKIIDRAIGDGEFSIALAQAIQCGCAHRQKDIIGEWIPVGADPLRVSGIVHRGLKWVGGITREEVNDDLILTHETSKKGTVLSFPLRSIPIIMDEWHYAPQSGPLIIDPDTGRPFRAWTFRRKWRELADKAGVPRDVVQMDTRAGRITHLLALGLPIEDVKKFVGHRQSQTTQGYSRDTAGAIARVADAAREQKAA